MCGGPVIDRSRKPGFADNITQNAKKWTRYTDLQKSTPKNCKIADC